MRPQLNWIERLTTDQKVVGSIPAGRAIFYVNGTQHSLVVHLIWDQGVAGSNPVVPTNLLTNGWIAQLARASGSYPEGREFESHSSHHLSWTLSSVGQSIRLITGGSQVRVLQGPPEKKETWRNTQVVEGSGLENRQVVKAAPGFESQFLRHQKDIAGWSSLVARRAHNPKVVGSNPSPATKWSGSSVGQNAALSRRRSRVRAPSRPPFVLVPQLSRQSRGLKILVSLVRFRPEPPFLSKTIHYMAGQLSWLEQSVHTRWVGGSNPFPATIKFNSGEYHFLFYLDPQLSWLELSAHNRSVEGSSPSGSTKMYVTSL